MSTLNDFDYEEFLRLSGLDLCRRMEPLLLDPRLHVDRQVVERLVTDLRTFRDEYHLVYALELLAKIAPELAVKQAPRYLAHSYGSVWCAAHNILVRLPDSLLTPELVADVETVALRNPGNNYVQKTWKELKARMERVGENTNQSKQSA
jgi:hypothetical protein